MTEQFTRLKESNLTVICRDCRKEFRGAEVRQHTGLEGHEVFVERGAAAGVRRNYAVL